MLSVAKWPWWFIHAASVATFFAVGGPVVCFMLGVVPTQDSPWWFGPSTFAIALLIAGSLWLPGVRYNRLAAADPGIVPCDRYPASPSPISREDDAALPTDHLEIDAAIIFALGGSREGAGIEPATLPHRMNALDDETQSLVQGYFDRTMKFRLPDEEWPAGVHDAVYQWLTAEMPDFSDVARQKLASYYTYSWR